MTKVKGKSNREISERSQKISKSLKGKESKFKGSNYEKMYGKNKSNEIKAKKSKSTRQKFFSYVQERLNQLQLIFLDDEYISPKEVHNFQCQICSRIFQSSYNQLKRSKYTCKNCKNNNFLQTK